MNDLAFFRNSARECRRMARSAASSHVRWQLLLFAREFDKIADDGDRDVPAARRENPHLRSLLDRLFGRDASHTEQEAAD